MLLVNVKISTYPPPSLSQLQQNKKADEDYIPDVGSFTK